MDKFLETFTLPGPNQEEIESMNRLISNNEIESVILKLPRNDSPGPESFAGKVHPTFKKS